MACAADTFDLLLHAGWAARSWHYPLAALAWYTILLGLDDLPRLQLKLIMRAWNVGLAMASVLGAAVVAPHLASIVIEGGVYGAVCTPPSEFQCGASGRVVWYFTLSKIVELGDTLWLKLSGRPVIFLHWYHHTTVLLFCWLAVAETTGVVGLWFATVNMCVHSVMYSYFASHDLLPSRVARRIAPMITRMQIAQMIWGAALIGAGAVYWAVGRPCALSVNVAISGAVMYASYARLFWSFHRRRKRVHQN